MEALSSGIAVVEVAERYGGSLKSVHAWPRRFRQDDLPGWLTDHTARITIPDSWPRDQGSGARAAPNPSLLRSPPAGA
jgi:transposase-like protein